MIKASILLPFLLLSFLLTLSSVSSLENPSNDRNLADETLDILNERFKALSHSSVDYEPSAETQSLEDLLNKRFESITNEENRDLAVKTLNKIQPNRRNGNGVSENNGFSRTRNSSYRTRNKTISGKQISDEGSSDVNDRNLSDETFDILNERFNALSHSVDETSPEDEDLSTENQSLEDLLNKRFESVSKKQLSEDEGSSDVNDRNLSDETFDILNERFNALSHSVDEDEDLSTENQSLEDLLNKRFESVSKKQISEDEGSSDDNDRSLSDETFDILNERFDALSHSSVDDVDPEVEDLSTETQSLEDLLNKRFESITNEEDRDLAVTQPNRRSRNALIQKLKDSIKKRVESANQEDTESGKNEIHFRPRNRNLATNEKHNNGEKKNEASEKDHHQKPEPSENGKERHNKDKSEASKNGDGGLSGNQPETNGKNADAN